MKKLYSLLFCLLLSACILAQSASQIIPKPDFISYPHASTPFRMDASTVIYFDTDFMNQAEYLRQSIEQQTGIPTSKTELNARNNLQREKGIYLLLNTSLNKEKYRLTIQAKNIGIEFATVRGLINGIQSLLQLIPLEKQKSISIEPVYIEDEPRFAYRGMHLDVARHFFPVDFIKKLLDAMSMHKLNVFHWHLTEDQGWRIEIKKYPKLTEIGAYRNGTTIGRYPGTGNTNTRYGGYYTQEQIKEIVKYAAD